jgi:hypothetical protein
MTLKGNIPAVESIRQKEIPLVTILFPVLGIGLMALLVWRDYNLYSMLSYEDHVVEWTTVVFYLTSFAYGLLFAINNRRIGDGLIALYCLVAGGEEFSWGQRLMGWSPPKIFMAGNQQQEINFHNFFSGGWHDLAFASVALGYFVLVPFLLRRKVVFVLVEKIGLSAPPIKLAPWVTLLVFIHLWHPILLSSEWCEALIAGMFFVCCVCLNRNRLSSKYFLVTVGLVLLMGIGLSSMSSRQNSSNAANISCSKVEVQHLLKDLLEGDAMPLTLELTSGQLRVFEAAGAGLLDSSRFIHFSEIKCPGEASAKSDLRRQFGLDPWGMSYWLNSETLQDGSRKLTIYSFGPNRRRDSAEARAAPSVFDGADDIFASGTSLMIARRQR